MNKRFSECEGFLLFVEHMRIEVGCFLRSPKQMREGFYSEALESVGFISALNNGESLHSAYIECKRRLSLKQEEKEILEKLFLSLGRGYLDESIKMIDVAYEGLNCEFLKLKDECPKCKKLVTSLCACAVVGFIIFVI